MHEGAEEFGVFGHGADEAFGVELDTDEVWEHAGILGAEFDGFDDAIFAATGDAEGFGEAVDGLVMGAPQNHT